MRNYVQDGIALDLTAPSGGVTSGLAYKIGSIICIAAVSAAAGAIFAGYTQGVYDVVSDTGTAWAEGDLVYWDNTNKVFTKTATSNTKAGVAATAKASGTAVGRVKLIPTI
jgi:predicted RecA/RadA family phage recombinase